MEFLVFVIFIQKQIINYIFWRIILTKEAK